MNRPPLLRYAWLSFLLIAARPSGGAQPAPGGSAQRAPSAAPVMFVGHATTKTEMFFVLRHVQSGHVSGWMALGQSFRGYTLERYDAKDDTVTVRTADGPLDLKIEESRVRDAAPANAGLTAETASKTLTLSGALVNPTRIDASRIHTLADAIAAAGGLKEGAAANAVRVTRREPDGKLALFTVDASPNNSGSRSAASFTLRPADIVFVPVKKPSDSKH